MEAYGTEVFAWGGELNSLVMREFQDFEGVLPAGCEQTRDVSAAVGKLQDLANVLESGAQCGLMDMTEVMQEVKQLQMQEGNHLLMMRRHNFATNLASVHVEWRQVWIRTIAVERRAVATPTQQQLPRDQQGLELEEHRVREELFEAIDVWSGAH